MTVEDFKIILPKAWTPRSDIVMTDLLVSNEPAIGQCAVTALVVQDYFGGQILNTIASLPDDPQLTSSHYFNVIDGKVVDLTRQQFSANVIFSESREKREGFPSARDYMLSFPSTVERYKKLKEKISKILPRADSSR